ncbi:MAG TPA: carboxypeptidase-like regulatory domain-containing protein [Vicinamibacterales bacterium]|nr:carboxypeptidase-like regulatory domain-containing protein [Vicinamibacterales bacterium]
MTMDSSGAMLPGVTVVATSPDKRVLATTTTDARGSYTLDGVPAGPVDLRFELEGFAPASIAFEIRPNAEVLVNGRLDIAPRAEAVEVRAPAKFVDRAPVLRTVPVPDHDRASVCGPSKAGTPQSRLGTIRSRLSGSQAMYGQGDQLLIDGGTETGLEPGLNLAVRRPFEVRGTDKKIIAGEHTAGLLQIVAADARVSTAVVIYACDEMRQGDFLAAVRPEPRREPDAPGVPSFDNPSRVLFADVGQIVGVPDRLMVLSSGAAQGLRAGQRLTLFRPKKGSDLPAIVGDAVVVALREDSSTIRVLRANDLVQFGDFAAPQR